MDPAGCLYLVATPIGNLEDITLRALRVLREADLIAAEDTRRTRKLLAHYDIHTPLRRCDAHRLPAAAAGLLDAVAAGQRVALVTDSGLPGVADPGRELVALARERGLPVEVTPGPSAVVTAFVAAAFPGEGFLFLGYLPSRRADRRRRLGEIADSPRAVVAFESPHRLGEALADIMGGLGPERPIAVVREMTKAHEEVFVGPVAEAVDHFAAREPRGEITLVLAPAEVSRACDPASAAACALASALVDAGLSRSEAARLVATHLGVPRGEVYDHLQRR